MVDGYERDFVRKSSKRRRGKRKQYSLKLSGKGIVSGQYSEGQTTGSRNIHFYGNKCGFKIVEYFNKNHPDPHIPEGEDLPGGEDFFRFEKVMKG